MKASIHQKLEQMSARFEEVGHLLSDADIISKQNKFRELSQEYAQLNPLVDHFNIYNQTLNDINNAKEMARDTIYSDDPDDAIPVLNRLLANPRFADLHNDLKSIHSSQERKKALRDFEPPTPQEIVNRLDRNAVVTVEGLRQLVIQELQDLQKAIDGGEFNSADRFYEKGERLGEVRSTEIIAERLNLRLEPQGISVIPEHQLKGKKRSDFTATKMIGGKRRLLVTEVKGQWHSELYTAASTQLHERYSIHPDAEQQGIYLAIWFGRDEKVAGRKRHDIGNAQELKAASKQAYHKNSLGLLMCLFWTCPSPNRTICHEWQTTRNHFANKGVGYIHGKKIYPASF